ncbi:alanine racemase [Allisonella histaminiformans]|uniref:alanine racemase n=1 Tax=Allisonella histaminiformans TaxID=209880 RepID=UPI00307F4D4E
MLRALNKAAGEAGKVHHVIIMANLGNLREGFWDKDEMVDVCAEVEEHMDNLDLAGVGVNVGCYGSVVATPEKLQELVDVARRVEERIGRKLDIVSGGASSSYMRVLDGNIPEGINNLRMGEEILLPQDLLYLYGYPLNGMYDDVFTLESQVIEVRDKPSYSVGELGVDAFGHKPVYIDKGIRRKVLLAMGHLDYCDYKDLIPQDKDVEILGCSSDHTIMDVTDAPRTYHVGDIVKFNLIYGTNLFLCHSQNVQKVFIGEE